MTSDVGRSARSLERIEEIPVWGAL